MTTACSFDSSKLRAQASSAQDGPVDYLGGPVDYPSALETRAAGGDEGHSAASDGAGGSTGIGEDGAGPRDALAAIDESDGLTAADAASAPDRFAAPEGAGGA